MTNIILPDFPYSQRFSIIDGTTISYIDEGDNHASAILFLHGVPTWSYTFRNIISVCLAAGYRIIAPDLPGFGLSSKPKDPEFYTLQNIVSWLYEFLTRLKVREGYLFAHDWGVILGLFIAAEQPLFFRGIIACNGFLPVNGTKIPSLFSLWKLFTRYSPFLPVGDIINLGCSRKLTRTEKMGYAYPFPTNSDKLAIRILPQIIPLKENDRDSVLIGMTWEKLKKWYKPFLTIFSDNDPITSGGDLILQRSIPGAFDQKHFRLHGKHFLQEDQPEEIGNIINGFIVQNL
jgi:haloalkane dehalogenase